MAIRTVITRGYGNGTFSGTIPLVTLRGYISGSATEPADGYTHYWRAALNLADWRAETNFADWRAKNNKADWRLE